MRSGSRRRVTFTRPEGMRDEPHLVGSGTADDTRELYRAPRMLSPHWPGACQDEGADDIANVLAVGGGGFSTNDGPSALDAYVLSLSAAKRPQVCFLATASGDAASCIEKFHAGFTQLNCTTRHLSLFERTDEDPATVLAAADVVYVGGGSTANLLALWRLHNIDRALAAFCDRGGVVCGVSAGALCWFDCGVTDSFGPELAALHDGLGWVTGSFCPHFDGEERRRPTYHRLVASGELPTGWGADDGAALHVHGDVVEAVAERDGAAVHRVEPTQAGVCETALPTRRL